MQITKKHQFDIFIFDLFISYLIYLFGNKYGDLFELYDDARTYKP
jgi:hypothetical protein